MDNAEKDILEARMNDGAPESGIYSEGEVTETDTDTDADTEDEELNDGGITENSEVETPTENAEQDCLAELCRVSGRNYKSIAEFPEHERFLQLMESGVLTAEEAFYAVNRGKTVSVPRSFDSKKHMASSIKKPSSGEVFSRADREELAKWGISATGSELERLWRGTF